MDPISVNTAVALANAFRSYIDGAPGTFTVTYENTRYTLVSEQNQFRDGPLVMFKAEHKDDNLWNTLMQFDGVVGVFATDALVVVSGAGTVRISYDVPDVPDGNYTVQPIPSTPFPYYPCECTTQRFKDEV